MLTDTPRLCLALTAAALATMPVRAESVEYPVNTVAGLLASCTYDDQDQAEIEYHFGTCIGYIKGVGNAAVALAESQGKPIALCLGEDSDDDALHDAVVEALAAWQGDPDANPAPIVLLALGRNFPCPPEAGGPESD